MQRIIVLMWLCVMVSGFHDEVVDDMVCMTCANTAFCTGGDSIDCPAHSLSDPLQFPASINDCVCVGGYERHGDVCIDGVAPYYYIDGVLQICAANMQTVINLADSHTDCVCDPGFEVKAGVCTRCQTGYYKPDTGNQSCTICDGGQYTNVTGMTHCLTCGVNTFAVSGDSECTDCRDNSQAPEGSDSALDCECNKGYFFDNGLIECTECEAGTFKNTVSLSDACTDCQANSNSPPASTAQIDCTCNVGYSGPDGSTCDACLQGFYKNVTGDAACESCAVNTYANATAMTVCFNCMPDSTAPAQSDHVSDCVCDIGHARIGTELEPECSSCAPGKFAGVNGCENCTDGTFTNTYGRTVCDTCPANSASYVSPHVDCQCDAGFKCDGSDTCPSGNCIPCDVNTFADTPGWRAACTPCQNHSQSLEASDHQDDCQCSTAYYEASHHVCEPCAPGTFTSTLDASECTVCEGDYKFTPVVPINSQNDCIDCVLCNDDQYDGAPCSGLTASDCQHCPENSGTLQSANPSNPNIGIESCSCDADFYGVLGGPCNVCQPPKVCDGILTKQHHNDHFCAEDSCSIRLYYGNSLTCREYCSNHGLLCEDATHIGSWGSCASGGSIGCDTLQGSMVCDCGYIAPLAEKVRSAGRVATDTTHQDCHCQVGHYHVSDIVCEPCQVGLYKDVAGNAPTCTACADGFTTLTTGSTSVNDCMCPPGHFLDGNTCTACPVNTFKDVISNATACTACRNNSVAGIGSTEEIQCECEPGYYLSAGMCIECPAGSIKSNVSNEACTLCPPDTFMPDPNSAATECLPCPSNESTHGDDGRAQCACVAGFEFKGVCDVSNWPDSDTFTYCGGCEVLLGIKADEYHLINSSEAGPARLFSSVWTTCDNYCNAAGLTCVGARGRFQVYQNPYLQPGVTDVCDHTQWTAGNEIEIKCSESKSSQYQICECSADVGSCEVCPYGEYRSDTTTLACSPCRPCTNQNQLTLVECSSTQNKECAPCQPNSNKPQGEEVSICYCNAGYEFDDTQTTLNDKCVACEVGKYKTTNSNNSISCQTCEAGKNALSTAMAECDDCELNCPAVDEVERYVSAECTPTSSIVCTDCTPCQTGYYSKSDDDSTTDTTCGVHFNNDRNDTVCILCEQGYYCVDGVRHACGANSVSETGSSQLTDCGCLPGFYAVADQGCQVCPRDFYCPGGIGQTLISCPVNSVNNYEGGTHVLDCNCLHGFYRTDQTETNFTCTLCSVNDYCYNNSAYNCSDSRQVSSAGSSSLTQCLCIDGWYNSADDKVCYECPIDSYCNAGNRNLCDADRWTFNQTRQDEPEHCLCRPGTFQDDTQSCTACLVNNYCIGDNTIQECPSHSVSPLRSDELFDCVCVMGYENVTSINHTHQCQLCLSGTEFKSSNGNFPCATCKVCSALEHGEYESQACVSAADAVCDACETCPGATQYIKDACTDFVNAVCHDCTVCDYDNLYWQRQPCKRDGNTQDTDCQVVTTTANCPVGQYRGQHTQTSDSICAACQYTDIAFNGYTLHEAVTTGLEYDNAFSCKVHCLGFSKLKDVNDHSKGCVSCETGNVLMKNFAVQTDSDGYATDCTFTCKSDYARITRIDGTEDCVAPALPASTRNSFSHTVTVSNYERIDAGTILTITHTSHSRFVVVIGASSPQQCQTIRGCCYSHLWRVSQLAQAGFPSSATSDTCSQSSLLTFNKIDTTTIRVEISDLQLATVANCSDAVNGTQNCHLVISLIDTVQWATTTTELIIQTTRTQQHVAFSGLHQYIALDDFAVDVFKAYFTVSGATVYIIKTRIGGTSYNATMRVTGMTQMLASEVQDCERILFARGHLISDTPVLPITTTSREIVTYWKGNSDLVSAFYTLYMHQDSDQDIAAVRNMSTIPPLCVPETHEARFDVGTVVATTGLGQAAVYALSTVLAPTQTTHGEVGSLFTFVAQAVNSYPTVISLRNLLAVYTKSLAATANVTAFANATQMVNGTLDFTYVFRHMCRQQDGDCAYEYFKIHDTYDTVHELTSCSTTAQDAARAWLTTNYGAVHDGGHVQAVCDRINVHADRNALAVFVHALRFQRAWQQYMQRDMPAIRASMWANFRFDVAV